MIILDNTVSLKGGPWNKKTLQQFLKNLSAYMISNTDLNLNITTQTTIYIYVSHVSAIQMQAINFQYRKKDKATNILSFLYEDHSALFVESNHRDNSISAIESIEDLGHMHNVNINITGELLLCPEVFNKEALAYGITAEQHYTHLIIHGILHLLGYDHEEEHEAVIMEHLEYQYLSFFGYTAEHLD